MGFQLKVHRVNLLKDVGIILDGYIESGNIFVGSEGTLASNPSRRVKIAGIGSHRAKDGSFSIFIATPDFPLAELEGAVIVGD